MLSRRAVGGMEGALASLKKRFRCCQAIVSRDKKRRKRLVEDPCESTPALHDLAPPLLVRSHPDFEQLAMSFPTVRARLLRLRASRPVASRRLQCCPTCDLDQDETLPSAMIPTPSLSKLERSSDPSTRLSSSRRRARKDVADEGRACGALGPPLGEASDGFD